MSSVQVKNDTQGVDYIWENLSYKVMVEVEETTPEGKVVKSKQWKPLIQTATGTARSGRVLAIMGPSGAGKTTLLNTVAGRIQQDSDHVVEGVAFLNKTVLSKEYKKAISYVAQDDIVMGKDTPKEALYFNYRMKLNAGHEAAEVAVDDMLEKLHLTKCQDTLLGIPGLIKGVSGGEKKRTNIGSELITNPKVLILDEPTTGLDSVNALRIGQLLQELARDEERTVLCTIHTPSSELYAIFDDVLLLAKGRVAFHGPIEDAPVHFAKLGHPVPPLYNPSEWYMQLLQLPDAELDALLDAWDVVVVESKESNLNLSIVGGPEDEDVSAKDEQLLAHCKKQGSGYGHQLVLLTARAWRMNIRDPVSTVGRLAQTLFFAILLGIFYFDIDNNSAGVQDRNGAMFMMAINAVFLSVMNGVAAFPPERAIFLMEQSNDTYNSHMYFLAKTIAETPTQLFFPVLYSLVVYWLIGLTATASAFFVFILVIIMTSKCSYSFGLLATAFFPTAEVAMAFVPMMLMPMMIVSGLFANTDRLDPGFLWLNYISFPRYAFTAIAVNEYSRIDSLCDDPAGGCTYQNGAEVIAFLGFQDNSWELSCIILACLLVAFRLLASLCLYVQGANRRAALSFQSNFTKRHEWKK